MNESFLFSVPGGEPVEIEPFHYCIVGQTQFSGKTTLIKRLGEWAVDLGYKLLVFDTKETEADYAGFGQEIPVCLRETTDSFVLIGLLESMFRRKLTPYYATLSRLSESSKDYSDIIRRAKDLESKTKSPWLRDASRVLYDLLERLKAETSKVRTVQRLELRNGMNRMVINDFSLEAQQLIVKNAFEDALRLYRRNLIMIIDEAFKFIPQGYSSAATRAIMNVMTQGAKTGLFGWISTQFLAITDKDPLKACAIKFLGTQDHATEVKHTLDLIPEARGKFSPDDIMKLKLGHWILVRKRPPDVRIVYAAPVGVPKDMGRKVALEEVTPEYIRDTFLKPSQLLEEDLMWKEKHEQLKKEFDEFQRHYDGKIEEMRAEIRNELRGQFETAIMKLEEENKRLLKEKALFDQATIEGQKAVEDLNKRLEELEGQVKEKTQRTLQLGGENAELRNELEGFRGLKDALLKIIPVPKVQVPVAAFPPGPSEISVTSEQPILSVKREHPPLSLTDKDLNGKVAIVYAEGTLGEGWFTVSDVTKAFKKNAWPQDPRVSKVLDEFCQWGYLEKRYSGKRPEYRVRMKPEDAKAKGLLKMED